MKRTHLYAGVTYPCSSPDHDGEFSAYAGARWGTLVRSAVFLGCTIDEAQDVAQTALLRCYTSWSRVRKADDPDAYVFRILLNCHRDSRRRRWWGERPTAAVPDRPTDNDPTATADTVDAVHRALGELSERNRQVMVLRYYADLSEQQTGRVLDISPGTVKSRLSRGLAQLANSPHLADLTEGPTR